MKEAAGEANLTVIAILLIGVIAAIATPVINSYMTGVAKKGCCTNYGGYWEDNGCVVKTATSETKIETTKYWNASNKTCADGV